MAVLVGKTVFVEVAVLVGVFMPAGIFVLVGVGFSVRKGARVGVVGFRLCVYVLTMVGIAVKFFFIYTNVNARKIFNYKIRTALAFAQVMR